MGMPFLVDAFLIHASFLGAQLVRKTTAGCRCFSFLCNFSSKLILLC